MASKTNFGSRNFPKFYKDREMIKTCGWFTFNSRTRKVDVKDTSGAASYIKLEVHTKGYSPSIYLVYIYVPLPSHEFVRIKFPNKDMKVPKIKYSNDIITDVNNLADYIYYIHRIKISKILDLNTVLKHTGIPAEIINEIGYYLLPK